MMLMVSVTTLSTEGCDYSHIDPKHTMCVFAPRMCHKKKLLRELKKLGNNNELSN